jgi:hypothetical protein
MLSKFKWYEELGIFDICAVVFLWTNFGLDWFQKDFSDPVMEIDKWKLKEYTMSLQSVV